MNETDANKIAHSFLCSEIKLQICNEHPDSFYDFNPSKEILFTFSLFGKTSVGGSKYISVTKENKKVRYLGFHGE